jgi:hypothetical protein
MGGLQAAEFANLVSEGQVSLDNALTWHLQSNHYPPVHLDFLPIAKQAIEYANGGDYDTIISMPNGIDKSVAQIIEGLHLESFLCEDGE